MFGLDLLHSALMAAGKPYAADLLHPTFGNMIQGVGHSMWDAFRAANDGPRGPKGQQQTQAVTVNTAPPSLPVMMSQPGGAPIAMPSGGRDGALSLAEALAALQAHQAGGATPTPWGVPLR